MIEWVLIFTMHISDSVGTTMPDVQMEMIDGFQSESACNKAGTTLALALIAQAGKHRSQHRIPARTKKEKYEKIRDKKLSTQIESLTKNLPEEIGLYLGYCRSLKFEEKPDIGYLRKLFKDLFYRMGYEYDYVFDWMVKKPNPQNSI